MKKRNFNIKTIMYTIILQMILLAFIFAAGLLDPLLGVIALAINFFIINSFFIFNYFNQKLTT